MWVAFLLWRQCSLMHHSFSFGWSPIHLFFSFVACAFDVIYRKWLPNARSWSFSRVFSSKSSIVSALLFILHYFLYRVLENGPTFLFDMWISSFPRIIWERIVLCPLSGLGILVKNSLTIYCHLFLGYLFYSIALCVCLYGKTILFWLL